MTPDKGGQLASYLGGAGFRDSDGRYRHDRFKILNHLNGDVHHPWGNADLQGGVSVRRCLRVHHDEGTPAATSGRAGTLGCIAPTANSDYVSWLHHTRAMLKSRTSDTTYLPLYVFVPGQTTGTWAMEWLHWKYTER